jgi:hypothetical protein
VRGLAAALPALALFLLEHEVDGGGGDGFADKPAADAGGEGAVPVSLDYHRPVTARAYSRQCSLHCGLLPFEPLYGPGGFVIVKARTHYKCISGLSMLVKEQRNLFFRILQIEEIYQFRFKAGLPILYAVRLKHDLETRG